MLGAIICDIVDSCAKIVKISFTVTERFNGTAACRLNLGKEPISSCALTELCADAFSC